MKSKAKFDRNMNQIIILILAIWAVAPFASAQQAAEAAAATNAQTSSQNGWHSEDITKWNDSITKLQTQIDQANKIIAIAGDPSQAVSFVTGKMNIQLPNLKPVMGLVQSAQQAASGVQSIASNPQGLYRNLQSSLPSGASIPRSIDAYKPFSAVESAYSNYQSITTDSDQQINRILLDMQNIAAAPATTTTQQTEKSNALLVKNAELAAAQERKRTAEQAMKTQTDLNTQMAEKNRKAMDEEQVARSNEINQEANNYSDSFMLK